MTYTLLSLSKIPGPAILPQRTAPDASRLAPDEPATTAMTDFTRECPVTVSPDRHIEDALQDMMRAGVRALLVLDEGHTLGLITSNDIQGERPIVFLQSPACVQDRCEHHEVRVADIMTPVAQLPALDLRIVQSACIGDLVETLKTSDHTHVVVTETQHNGAHRLRGLISRSWLERQLGTVRDAVHRNGHDTGGRSGSPQSAHPVRWRRYRGRLLSGRRRTRPRVLS